MRHIAHTKRNEAFDISVVVGLKRFDLSDGSAMLLAVAEWITPDGHVIWHKGITPDVGVSLPVGATQLYPDKEKSMNSAQLQASGDAQLLKAFDLLQHRMVGSIASE